jgi:hypothetical protein
MMGAAAPGPATPLPCQADPERWFDRTDRVPALTGCLRCPVRRWCARQALQQQASWGMWAGIWIGDDPARAAAYLSAIAADAPAEPAARQLNPRHVVAPISARGPSHRAPARSSASPHRPVRGPVPSRVIARSSGHCEILAAGCRYSPDAITSRLTGSTVTGGACASQLFVACVICRQTVDDLPRRLAHSYGYRIGSAAAAAVIPFYWRQSRWVLLDPGGRMLDPIAAQTA